MPKKVKPVPKGYHSVTPALNQANAADTIAFCKKAFGAKELMRMPGPGGSSSRSRSPLISPRRPATATNW